MNNSPLETRDALLHAYRCWVDGHHDGGDGGPLFVQLAGDALHAFLVAAAVASHHDVLEAVGLGRRILRKNRQSQNRENPSSSEVAGNCGYSG